MIPLLAYVLCLAAIGSCSEWLTNDFFISKLPANLKPIYDVKVDSKAECFALCEKISHHCDSIAFSEAFLLCKIYSHLADQKMPLPKLKPDPVTESQMFYKKLFCPPGWQMEESSQMCYLIGTESLQRPEAWKVCDESFQSELVTFQNAASRVNLYKLLRRNYEAIVKFWTGYFMFDNRLWPRPVAELQSYIKRRGDCWGNDIDSFVGSLGQCVLKCDRTYRDKCVGFTYNPKAGRCWFKTKSCDNMNNNPLTDDLFFYDKVSPSRPVSSSFGVHCAGNDIMTFADGSQWSCYQRCKDTALCVAFAYRPSDKLCALKFKTCLLKSGGMEAGYVYADMGEVARDAGPCLFGIRYHDVCLTLMRGGTNFDNAHNSCRRIGGTLLRPVEHEQKARVIFGFLKGRNAVSWFDLREVTTNNNWISNYDGENFTETIYDRIKWNSNEPNGGTALFCGVVIDGASGQPAGFSYLDDASCTNSNGYICETPVSQWYPTTCRFTPPGAEYMGTLSRTASGISCKTWSTDSTYTNLWRQFPDWHISHSNCRNPDLVWNSQSVWCIRETDSQKETCDVPMCPETDWASGQVYQDLRRPYAAITKTASADDDYDWTVEDVAAVANPICMMPADSWCPLYFRGSCYKIFNLLKNGTEARDLCSKHGWHLATLTSTPEQHFIRGQVMMLQRMVSAYTQGYWIGLSGTSWSTGYFWDTGERLMQGQGDYRTNEPSGNENCTQMGLPGNDGRWNDCHCHSLAYPICEIEFGS